MLRILFTSALTLAAGLARAEPIHVVADIAPIHSLVAQVMGSVGTPDLLVPPGAEVHDLALRPSDARKLAQADVVIWVGADLTPWLTDPLETLAPTAATLTLLEVPGWMHRPLTKEQDHADPHAWLDPEVAVFWVQSIRDTLSTTDPDNAAAYAANADRTLAGLSSLRSQITATLAEVPGGTWLAPHDAFGYFSDRFGLPSAGAIAGSDDQAPGPAHLAALRDMVLAGEVTCVLSETEGPTDYADLLTEGTPARTAQIDDIGFALEPGPDLYAALLTGIATTLTDCIGR